jgi:hypothetical protein
MAHCAAAEAGEPKLMFRHVARSVDEIRGSEIVVRMLLADRVLGHKFTLSRIDNLGSGGYKSSTSS